MVSATGRAASSPISGVRFFEVAGEECGHFVVDESQPRRVGRALFGYRQPFTEPKIRMVRNFDPLYDLPWVERPREPISEEFLHPLGDPVEPQLGLLSIKK